MKINKKCFSILILICLTCFFVGCNSTKVVNNNGPEDTTKTDNPINPSKDNTHTDEIENSEEDAFAKTLLNDIKDSAQNGKIVKCDFGVKDTNISTVEDKWGKADSTDFVAAAKGTYSTFEVQRVAFGWNKGMQVFEARSFDEDLKEITYGLLEENLGKPSYSVEANGEKIVGYKAGEEFKILFVFKFQEDMSKASLHHYSVLYPVGTVNSMAGDPGREW